MADDPANSVTVEIRARLDALERDLAAARARLNQFDKSFGTSGKRLKELEGASGSAALALGHLANQLSVMQGPLGPVAGRVSFLAAGLGSVGVVGLAAGVGISAATMASKAALAAFTQLEREQATYAGVLEATGYAAGRTASDIEDLATSIRKSSTATEGAVREAAAKLLTFKAVSGEAFDEALKLSQDLAAVGFGSITSAAMMMGKAIEDPERGLTALRRAGVTFSEAQKNVIKDLLETGQRAEAVKMILKGVSDQVGGASVTQAKTLSGAYNQLSESINNLLERWGSTIAKSIGLDASVRALAEAIDKQNKAAEHAVTALGQLEAAEARYQALLANRTRLNNFGVGRGPSSLVNRSLDKLQIEKILITLDLDDAELGAAMLRMRAASGKAEADAQRIAGAVKGTTDALELEAKQLRMTAQEREVDAAARKANVQGIKEEVDKINDAIIARNKERDALTYQQARVQQLGAAATMADVLRAREEALNVQLKEQSGRLGEIKGKDIDRARSAIQLEVLNEFESRRISLLGVSASVTDQVAAKMRELTLAGMAGLGVTEKQSAAILEYTRAQALGTLAMTEQIDRNRIEATTLGQSLAAVTSYRLEHERLARARREGQPLTDADIEKIRREASAAGESEQALARLRLTRETAFERRTMFMSEEDVRIAQQLRGIYGDDIPRAFASTDAAALRMNSQLKMVGDFTKSSFSHLEDALVGFANGSKTAQQAFNDMAKSIISDLLRMIIRMQITIPLARALSSLLGGFFGAPASAATSGFNPSGMSGYGFYPSGMAEGGPVRGSGTSTSDSIPTLLSNGEFVVNAQATARHRRLLEAINRGDIRRFALGGVAGPAVPQVRALGEWGGSAAREAPRTVSIRTGDTHIVIQGDASEKTVALIRSELATRDARLRREMPAIATSVLLDSKSRRKPGF